MVAMVAIVFAVLIMATLVIVMMILVMVVIVLVVALVSVSLQWHVHGRHQGNSEEGEIAGEPSVI
jgi:hypothetical protein